MIIVDAQKYKSIEQALKVYKQKHNKIGITKALKDRQEFEKPSITKRTKLLKAKYINRLRTGKEI
jgi:small subunit ribosomal protein S21